MLFTEIDISLGFYQFLLLFFNSFTLRIRFINHIVFSCHITLVSSNLWKLLRFIYLFVCLCLAWIWYCWRVLVFFFFFFWYNIPQFGVVCCLSLFRLKLPMIGKDAKSVESSGYHTGGYLRSVYLIPRDIILNHLTVEVSARFLPWKFTVFPFVLNSTIIYYVSVLTVIFCFSQPFYMY